MKRSSTTADGSTLHGTSDPSAASFPINSPKPASDWKQQLAKHWWGLKLADRATQVEKDHQRQLILQRLMKKQQDGTIGEKTDDPWPDPEDMAVSVGDQYHWHQESSRQEKSTGGLAKVLLGLLVSLGLVGGPLVTYLLSRQQDDPVVVQPGGDSDTDTGFLLDFGE